jgi:hypothetical protein
LFEGYVLQVLVHDDDAFANWLYHRGSLCDSYWSTPGYFGERYRAGQEKMTGRADTFRPLIGDAVELLLPILNRAVEQPVFMSEKLASSAESMGELRLR